MSRAGKFIPGGGGKAPVKGTRTDPIRAPEPGKTGNEPAAAGGPKKPFGRGLVKPVAKNQRLPIVVMSGLCCLLISIASGYFLAYLPAVRARDASEAEKMSLVRQLADEKAAEEAAKAKALLEQQTARGSLSVDSTPSGADVTIGDFRKKTPATFADIIPGTFSIVIQLDGYEDYKQNVTVTADQPNNLGTITLVQKTGNLSLTSPLSDVTYKLSGPNGYSHDGQIPDKVQGLPIGEYALIVAQKDWQLPAIPVTIRAHDTALKDIKFPYATVVIGSTPPGATVRDGRTVLGQTPLTLNQVRPKDFKLSLDLPPYTVQRIDVHVPDFGNMNKQVTLTKDKDFVAACGMPMVWIQNGGFWAGKYLVRQVDLDTVGASDPSTFRRPNRPVETISWEAAMAFCDQLNQYEKKAGKLPAGFHYTLPKESQWEAFSADADINLAATSRMSTLSSTQDAGYSEPNTYGIYDSIGNVWEWCLDNYDANGNHSLRGGCWLSSTADFPNAETRNAGGPKYSDRFTGFRVVLVQD
jgi:hypothetical protein